MWSNPVRDRAARARQPAEEAVCRPARMDAGPGRRGAWLEFRGRGRPLRRGARWPGRRRIDGDAQPAAQCGKPARRLFQPGGRQSGKSRGQQQQQAAGDAEGRKQPIGDLHPAKQRGRAHQQRGDHENARGGIQAGRGGIGDGDARALLAAVAHIGGGGAFDLVEFERQAGTGKRADERGHGKDLVSGPARCAGVKKGTRTGWLGSANAWQLLGGSGRALRFLPVPACAGTTRAWLKNPKNRKNSARACRAVSAIVDRRISPRPGA